MNELQYKLIVSDLDGTLLNGKGKLTDRTLEAVRQYQSRGGLFTFATGRTEESAGAYADRLGIKIPGIAFNGGKVVCLTDGRVIYETFMDAAPAKKAYAALRAHKKDVIVYLDKTRYVADYTAVIDKYLARVRHSLYLARGDADAIFDGRASLKKLLVIDPKQDDELILNMVLPIFGDNINFVKSDPEYYEFMPPGTSKGKALTVLAEHLGVGPGETAAIGDHLNDISMLEAAGLGVAVANAERETLDAAGYITASNDEDGVALFIEKLLGGEYFSAL